MAREHAQRIRMMVLGATAALSLGSAAYAQFSVDRRGITDANSRVDAFQRRNEGYVYTPEYKPNLPNQIVTGNVTGAKEFRGNVPYRDVSEFRGSLSTDDTDRLVRRSAGTAHAEVADKLYSPEARPFYGQSRTVRVPEGYVSMGQGVGGYVGVGPGGRGMTGQGDTINQQTFQRDTVFGRGGATPSDQTITTASPLTGVRQWRPEQVQGDAYLQGLLAGPGQPSGAGGPTRSAAPQQARAVEGLRRDLYAPSDVNEPPLGTAIAPAAAPSSEMPPATLEPTARQATRQRLTVPAEPQSPQHQELRRRLGEFERDQDLTDEQAHRQFVEQATQNPAITPGSTVPMPAATTAPRGATPQGPQGGAPMGDDALGQAVQAVRRPPGQAARPAPLAIEALSAGVPEEELRSLLESAEGQLKQQQYSAALDSYDRAARVAPGDPLVNLGRAHTELAAGLYGRAEAHLRQAVTSDRALMMGRYDLRSAYGDERLATVVTDLERIAQTEPTEARPMLLLAYLAYNTGEEAKAGEYLDQAAERAGPDDPLPARLRQHWGLSAQRPPTTQGADAAPAQP